MDVLKEGEHGAPGERAGQRHELLRCEAAPPEDLIGRHDVRVY
jgi:hypothetical protein